jgi:hypothetical protein
MGIVVYLGVIAMSVVGGGIILIAAALSTRKE